MQRAPRQPLQIKAVDERRERHRGPDAPEAAASWQVNVPARRVNTIRASCGYHTRMTVLVKHGPPESTVNELDKLARARFLEFPTVLFFHVVKGPWFDEDTVKPERLSHSGET